MFAGIPGGRAWVRIETASDEPVTPPDIAAAYRRETRARRRISVQNYPARPGTGPKGETCISCANGFRFNGVNNGEITFGVREAEEIGLGKSSTAELFAELVRLGFLVVT